MDEKTLKIFHHIRAWSIEEHQLRAETKIPASQRLGSSTWARNSTSAGTCYGNGGPIDQTQRECALCGT